MRGIRARSRGDAAPLLEHDLDVVVDPQLRPASHRLGGVESLVRHVARIHRRAVVLAVDDRVGRVQVEPAGLEHQPGARLLRDLGPGGVGRLGEPDVGRIVVGEADDAGVILRLTAVVSQLELLEADHPGAATSEPVGRGAADATEPEHDDVRLVHAHVAHDIGRACTHTTVDEHVKARRPRPVPDRRGLDRGAGAPQHDRPRAAHRVARLPPLLGRRAPRDGNARRIEPGGAARGDRRGDVAHAHRQRRSDAAPLQPAQGGRDLQRPERPVWRPDRSRRR